MSDDATMTYAASSPPTESHKGRPVVYVYGLTPRVLERHLDEIFGFYGPIKRLRLFPHERPSAMIEFEQEDSVELALTHMDQGQIDGAHVTVSIDPRPDLEEAPLHSPAPWKERKSSSRRNGRDAVDHGWPQREADSDRRRSPSMERRGSTSPHWNYNDNT